MTPLLCPECGSELDLAENCRNSQCRLSPSRAPLVRSGLPSGPVEVFVEPKREREPRVRDVAADRRKAVRKAQAAARRQNRKRAKR